MNQAMANIDFDSIKQQVSDYFNSLKDQQLKFKIIFMFIPFVLLLIVLLGSYWSQEPESFSIKPIMQQESDIVIGTATTQTLIKTMDVLLKKPGGYLTNDVLPPSVWLDNIPNWEFGVLVQARDLSLAMRNDFSRSQSQSTEDKDLLKAQPQFNFNSDSWILPSTEGEYQKGINALQAYALRLSKQDSPDAQFYARADNLSDWLSQVEKRLGSLSQRLSASTGQVRINTDLAGDSAAKQSTKTNQQLEVKTPWTEIDDVFYEARGSAWALMHYLKAIEIDFQSVLTKKNALISLRQIIRELEASQESMWSPMILNGSGFGLFANHSLVMASYISRANAAVIDLRQLLKQG